MFRKENGVTLVALVITIIVLLILAGVTISMVMGDNSILGNAESAGKKYSESEIRSAITLAVTTANSEQTMKKYNGETASAVSTALVKEELDKMGIDDTKIDWDSDLGEYKLADGTSLWIKITPGSNANSASTIPAQVEFSATKPTV